tara:strand:- start:840 stop:1187 length:348 start_codon:yes stop_codon:yes gene_type:complete
MSVQSVEKHQMRMFNHTLSEVIVRDGYRSVQLHRVGRIAIYRRQSIKAASVHFEVVKILVEHKTRELPSGSIRKAGDESYPSSSTWGTHGWTFQSLERAQDKFTQIIRKDDSQCD